MFDMQSGLKPPRGRAFTIAVTAHVVVLAIATASTLLAIEPIAGPNETLTYFVVTLPAAAAVLPAPARPEPSASREPDLQDVPLPPTLPRVPPPAVDLLSTHSPSTAIATPGPGPGGGPPGSVTSAATATTGPPLRGITEDHRVVTVGGDVTAPRVIDRVRPRYPMAARATRTEGEVVIEAIIDERGAVRDVRVLSGPALLRDAAIDAVRAWRFEPGRLNGEPVAVYFTLRVRFRLR